MRPAIASIMNEEDIWKASNIHKAAFYCIFLSSLSRYAKGTLL